MNIRRLKTLASTIEKGVVEFPELQLNVAFNLEAAFVRTTMAKWWIPKRSDIPDPSTVNACGCTMGFTILLFSPLKWKVRDGMAGFHYYTEAKLELDLDMVQACALFYEKSDRYITGADAARVIRKLILTEEVDWSITRQ